MIGAIILQVILIALNAVFTCAETAIVSLNDNQLEEMAKKDEAKVALLSGFKAKQERFLTAMHMRRLFLENRWKILLEKADRQ